jgi:hypothetical protein
MQELGVIASLASVRIAEDALRVGGFASSPGI